MGSIGQLFMLAVHGCLFPLGAIILVGSIVLCAILAPVILIPLFVVLGVFALAVLQARIN